MPTLIKELPLPVRVLIGDFTDEPRVRGALSLTAAQDDSAAMAGRLQRAQEIGPRC